MSHNYLRDLAALRSLVGTEVAYIGALGPGERLGRLLSDLRGEGVVITEADLGKLHGPAGLDIGAEGPVEIAWSVMSEILAVRRSRPGGRLRVRKGPTRPPPPALPERSEE
jgi:xanthine/CO dehydrogenase XdhC/CoxF family maturation factor